MLCLSRPYAFNFFKGCIPQHLLTLLLNTLSHIQLEMLNIVMGNMNVEYHSNKMGT